MQSQAGLVHPGGACLAREKTSQHSGGAACGGHAPALGGPLTAAGEGGHRRLLREVTRQLSFEKTASQLQQTGTGQGEAGEAPAALPRRGGCVQGNGGDEEKQRTRRGARMRGLWG